MRKLILKWLLLVLFMLLAASPAWGADSDVYIDSNAAAGGDGSITTPHDALSDYDWSTGGDRVHLARGSVFNETIPYIVGGSAALPTTIDAYGSGAKPIIKKT